MTSNSTFPYPAEYYYPEFVDNRQDEPRNSPLPNLPLSASIDNGIGSSTTIPTTASIKKKPTNKKPTATSVALDIVTYQGLPATDITEAGKADPKKSLVRDPAERNIPRLIVDDSVIQQAVRTPRIMTSNQNHHFVDPTINSNQINNNKKHLVNGHANGDLTNKTKQQTVHYVGDEQPVDEYWKKEVYIDDQGVVTIEPLKYDKNSYEGPFGLTRKGSFIFYIGLAIFTLLAAVFLIMTGVFYSQNYPDNTGNTGKLAGIGICALAFYLGLQLILIGLWHQKYRQENPNRIEKSTRHHDSSAHLHSSMEENEPYDYSYQQQMDYTPYESYTNPHYVANTNEQMLLQQPGVVTSAGYYEPVAWPSNGQVETQPDATFFQPMELTYGPQPAVESASTTIAFTTPPTASNNNNNKSEKKSHRHRHHQHNKKTVETNPPKPKSDNNLPKSTVIEPPLPVLNRAPQTAELIKSIAEMEKNTQQSSSSKHSNRIKPVDNETEVSSSNTHHRHHHSRHRHHHQHRHYRHHSYSPCSTCSSRSHNGTYSDMSYDHHHHHHHPHQHTKPVEKIITPRTTRVRTRTISPPKGNTRMYRETGIGDGLQSKIMRDSSVTADLEYVPNVGDNRLEQIPVVRRTIIVEPYPAQPSSQIIVKPQSNMTGKIHLGRNQQYTEDNETITYPSTIFMNQKSKKKRTTTTTINNNHNYIEDLKLEDVNDEYDNETEYIKPKKKNMHKTSSKKNVKNAFYD